MLNKIPPKILFTLSQLEQAGWEAFLVGGCVRDLLLNKEPQDWDITTNAKPKDILKVFPEAKYENNFGTVILPVKYIPSKKEKTFQKKKQKGNSNTKRKRGESNKSNDWDQTGNIEITTYRIESTYSDYRRPDKIRFAQTLKEDLSRRDFTINAMALKIFTPSQFKIIDLYQGKKDLKKHLIRTVANPNDRFNEDALRMMRAIRFTSQLSQGDSLDFLKNREGQGKQNQQSLNKNLWRIEKETFSAIQKNSHLLKYISSERIRDELEKIILSQRPAWGIELLVETNLMKYIIPEIYKTIGIKQNRHHYYGPYNTVYKHMLASLKKCPSRKLEVRLAAWLHDIGKPQAKKGEGYYATFYGHEYIGARITQKILERLKFPRKIIDKTVLLVKNHMFYYDVDKVGEHGVRRVIQKVGLENINDLIDVRISDRLGSGVPKAVPYKLRHFQYMVKKLSHDPLSVKQLKINGHDIIQKLKIKPGPIVGALLEILLAKVLENPRFNQKEKLLNYARQLQKKDLKTLRQIARQKINSEKEKTDQEIKKEYYL